MTAPGDERPFASVIVVTDDPAATRDLFEAEGYRSIIPAKELPWHDLYERLIPPDGGRADVQLVAGDQAVRLIRYENHGLPTRLTLPECDLWVYPTGNNESGIQMLLDLRADHAKDGEGAQGVRP